MKFKSITLTLAVGLLIGTSGSIWSSGNNIAFASTSGPQVRSILPNNDRTQIFDTLNGHYQEGFKDEQCRKSNEKGER